MKTALQEFIDNVIPMHIIELDMIKQEIKKALEKEKEQIIEAVKFGQNNYTVSIPEDEMIAKNYFNDKYEVVEKFNQNK